MRIVPCFIFYVFLMSGPSSIASTSGGIELEFSLSGESSGRFYNGNLGRIMVSLDREEGMQTFAVFKMENIPESEKKVSFAKVTTLEKNCAGVPASIFEYNRFAFDQQVLPQAFAIGRESCVLIEFYHQDIYGKLMLIDEFQVLLKK